MAEHTPVPWEHGSRGNARFVVYGGKAVHGKAICVMRSTQADPPDHPLNLEADANAEFIVQACNAHDELLAALERQCALLEAMALVPNANHVKRDIGVMLTAARAALAKAKGI